MNIRQWQRASTAVVLASLGAALAGCAGVEAYDRDILARPDMQFDYDRLDVKTQQHIYTSKEAATGGYGVGGGGCGCN